MSKISKTKTIAILSVALLLTSCSNGSATQIEQKQPIAENNKSSEAQAPTAEVPNQSAAATGDTAGQSSDIDLSPTQQDQDPSNEQEMTEKERIAAKTRALVEKLNAQHKKDADAERVRQEELEPIVYEPEIELPEGAKQVFKRHEVWLDKANNQVIVGGKICINEGQLEMFACPQNTKEHESVVSVNATSFQVHGMFIALGFNPGKPVTWHPKYVPARGPIVDIEVAWRAGDVVKRLPVQQMIRNVKTEKAMATHFVFGGSRFYEHEDGRKEYFGDAGELVCLSNFETATMDIPLESASDDSGLLYEAFTENVPPVNTQVYLFFRPQAEEEGGEGEGQVEGEGAAGGEGEAEEAEEAGGSEEGQQVPQPESTEKQSGTAESASEVTSKRPPASTSAKKEE